MFLNIKITLENLDLNIQDKTFTLFISQNRRTKPDYKKKSTFKNFNAPIVEKKSELSDVTNSEVAKFLDDMGTNIFLTPINQEFKKDTSEQPFLRDLFYYLVASLSPDKQPTFREKQQLANTIIAIIINYVARGGFGLNKADRNRGLLTGQLLESLRGKMSD
jgi:hypothetical protein